MFAKHWFGLTMAAFLAFSALACGDDDPEPDNTVKAAWVYVSPIGDAGWTHAHNEGRLEVEAAFDWVETTYVENVPEGTETAGYLRDLADAGNDIIFTTSFGFMEPTQTVAGEYPDIHFEHCSGYLTAANMTNYFGRMYQARYLSGIVAGHATVNKRIGYVAAFDIPEVIRGINAFTLGAQSVDPTIEVYVAWTKTWFDPTLEGAAAQSLVDTHDVDLLTQHQDSTATVSVAQTAGIKAIGYDSDMSAYAPGTVLTCPVWHWGPYYKRRVQAHYDGTWTNETFWGGLEDGIVGLSPYSSDVTQTAQNEVAAAETEIINGTFDVFEGPINKQDGTEWLADGVTMNDGDMLSMDTFVEGVVGTLPAP